MHTLMVAAASGGIDTTATNLKTLATVVFGALFFVIVGGMLLFHLSKMAIGAILALLLISVPVAAAVSGSGLSSFFSSTAKTLGLG